MQNRIEFIFQFQNLKYNHKIYEKRTKYRQVSFLENVKIMKADERKKERKES